MSLRKLVVLMAALCALAGVAEAKNNKGGGGGGGSASIKHDTPALPPVRSPSLDELDNKLNLSFEQHAAIRAILEGKSDRERISDACKAAVASHLNAKQKMDYEIMTEQPKEAKGGDKDGDKDKGGKDKGGKGK